MKLKKLTLVMSVKKTTTMKRNDESAILPPLQLEMINSHLIMQRLKNISMEAMDDHASCHLRRSPIEKTIDCPDRATSIMLSIFQLGLNKLKEDHEKEKEKNTNKKSETKAD